MIQIYNTWTLLKYRAWNTRSIFQMYHDENNTKRRSSTVFQILYYSHDRHHLKYQKIDT